MRILSCAIVCAFFWCLGGALAQDVEPTDRDAAAASQAGKAARLRVAVSSARYGAQDGWCSATAYVVGLCSHRETCTIVLPAVAPLDPDLGAREAQRRRLICGPVNASNKMLSIGWYCTDGLDAIGQAVSAIADGESGQLSCRSAGD